MNTDRAIASYARICMRMALVSSPDAIVHTDFGLLCERVALQLTRMRPALVVAYYMASDASLVIAAVERALSGDKLHPVLRVLFEVLFQKSDLLLSAAVCDAIARMVRHHAGIERCKITTAVAADEAMRTEVEQQLARAWGKKIEATWTCDRALIAGIRVEGDTRVWEHSVQQQLRQYQQLIDRYG